MLFTIINYLLLQEIYRELDDNRPKVEALLQQGNDYLKKQPNVAGSNLQHTLRALKQRWDAVNARYVLNIELYININKYAYLPFDCTGLLIRKSNWKLHLKKPRSSTILFKHL